MFSAQSGTKQKTSKEELFGYPMRGTKMKLNYKRTIFVGFAFFLICTFWQAYDTIIPKILTDKFGMSQAASGVVMALDNVLAIFLLPLFGAISDKTNTKLGRRTPFIIAGTLAPQSHSSAYLLLIMRRQGPLTVLKGSKQPFTAPLLMLMHKMMILKAFLIMLCQPCSTIA